MPTNILMPALSPTMTEGTLAKWLKKEGDTIRSGDVIAEIETDKATMEVEAADEGKIGKIIVAAGTAGVKVNEVIAILLAEGETANDLAKVPQSPVKTPAAPTSLSPASTPVQKVISPTATVGQSASTSRIFATPLARRIAAERGVHLSSVKGTGPGGRVVKADVLAAPAGGVRKSGPAGPAMDARALADALGMGYVAVPHSGVRKVIAARLQESKQTVPHFYLTVECQIDSLLSARKALNDQAGGTYKLSVNDFVIKAVAAALKTYPAANVAWTDEAMLQFSSSDISVAVATPNGLITPIVKAAETKSLPEISAEIKDLAARAREGKLKPTEFQGGTFSISNLGMYGIKEFGAIINPPQACILAVGAGIEQPVVVGGRVEIRTVMTCTLSVDHRAVDGAAGAEFLQIFKKYIEDPILMLV